MIISKIYVVGAVFTKLMHWKGYKFSLRKKISSNVDFALEILEERKSMLYIYLNALACTEILGKHCSTPGTTLQSALHPLSLCLLLSPPPVFLSTFIVSSSVNGFYEISVKVKNV